MPRLVAAVLLAAVACGAPAPPPVTPPVTPPPVIAEPPPRPPARADFPVGASPMSLVVAGAALVWTDSTGAIWTMPSDGRGEPHQLSDQKAPDFAFHLFTAGRDVLATSRGDLLRVGVPDGPVTKANIRGLLEYPEESVADDAFVYLTMFKRNEIVRVPVAGGAAQKLAELPRGVLALHGGSLYAASYSTGVLVEIPTAGGKQRVIARGLPRPTAVVVDDRHAYVYCERDETLRRIELATGTAAVIARQLVNSDDLVLDGDHVYTRSWGKRPALVRVAKDGSRPQQVVAEGLAAPYHIAIDADAVYVTSRDNNMIVRLDKAALPP